MEKKNNPSNSAELSKTVPIAEARSQEMNQSERFAAKVMQMFGSAVGPIEANENMRQLIQGYFIGIDRALKLAEEGRLRKKKNQDPTPVTWQNVNLNDLALDVMYYAKVGLDMSMDNHLFAIPFKNNKSGLYDVTLMQGYNGIQFIAERYALDRPLSVTIELVYSNDTFTAVKKSRDNKADAYMFDITQPFDRGEVVGGFGYLEYDNPSKNKLIVMTRAQIEKRKPQYASPEFWGGEKDDWQNGQMVGKKHVEGWFEEMCLKTLKREVYSAKHMPRDPAKIDENYRYLKRRDAEAIESARRAAMDGYIHADVIDISPDVPQNALTAAVDRETGEITDTANTAVSNAREANNAQPIEQQAMGMDF